MKTDDFLLAVRTGLEAAGTIAPETVIISAISGGADSAAMTDALVRLSGELCFKIVAAHLNHGIRAASDGEAAEVEAMCRRWGVPLITEKINVPAEAADRKLGLEQCARDMRYSFFRRAASAAGARFAATAHTADDNLETVILNLVRGAGMNGLSGIPPARIEDGITFVRPLLRLTRRDVENYCALRGIKYLTDESNFSEEYTRNRIRLRVVPELLAVNPSAAEAVSRLCESLRRDNAYLAEAAKSAEDAAVPENGEASAEELAKLPTPLLRRILGGLCEKATGCALGYDAFEALRQAITSENTESRKLDLCGGFAWISAGRLKFFKNGDFSDMSDSGEEEYPLDAAFSGPEAIFCGGKFYGTLRLRHLRHSEAVNILLNNLSRSNDTICGGINPAGKVHHKPSHPAHNIPGCIFALSHGESASVRLRREGDVMCLRNRPEKRLKKLFIEAGIPGWRRSAPLVAVREKIVCARGLGTARDYAFNPESEADSGKTIYLAEWNDGM